MAFLGSAAAQQFYCSSCTHLGQVATRSGAPTQFDVSYNYVQTRSSHYFRSAVTAIQIRIPCWYIVANGSGSETNTGSFCTATAGVEYPSGTFTQVTFGGNSTATISDGTTVLSDAISVTIPANTQTWVRIWMHNTSGVPIASTPEDSTLGEAMDCSASVLTDKTTSGTVTQSCSGSNGILTPISIIAATSAPSICIVGDSRAFGIDDTINKAAPGDYGDIAPSIGGNFGYISMSVSGRTIAEFNSSNALEVAIADADCTYVIGELGINDFIGGANAATVESRWQTSWALFSGPRLYQTTLEPKTSSSDSWATISNQTVSGFSAQWLLANSYLAGVPSPLSGYFDVASAVTNTATGGSSCTSTGICWNAPPAITADGTHENGTGYAAIPTANVIPLSAFHFP